MMRRESPYLLFLRRNPGWLLALLLLLVQIVLIGLVFMLASSQRPATEAGPAYQPAGLVTGLLIDRPLCRRFLSPNAG